MRASRLLLAMTLLALPCPAAATPVAEVNFDIDGDGAGDRIRVEAPGEVHVTLARGRVLRQRFEAPPGPLVAAQVSADAGAALSGRRVIVVTATFATEAPASAPLPVPGAPGDQRSEALVLAWQAGGLVRLWQGPVGPRGDGEHSVHVALTPQGLLRYQARPDVQRCDGQPMYLHPHAWDFRSASFRPVYNAPRLPMDAPVLVATPEPPPGAHATMASSFRTRAASTQAGAGDAGELVPPRELDDGDPATAWRESLGGNGRGEIITLGTSLPRAEVAAVRIVPGDAAGPERFRRSNRLRRVGLLVGAERAFWIDFPADPAASKLPADTAYWAVLPAPVAAACVTLVLDSVYPGAAGSARAGDTAIAELAVLTTLDLAPGGAEATLIERVRAGGEAGRSAARLLAQRGVPAVAAVRQALEASALSDDERLRLRRVLAEIRDPGTAAELVEGMAQPGASRAERRDFLRALVGLGAEAVPALAALLADQQATLPARIAAVRALGAMPDPAARAPLLAAAGQGPRPLRRAVALALGHRDPGASALHEAVDALIEAALQAGRESEAGRESDIWRALGLLARRADAPARDRALAAMTARLDTAAGYELLARLVTAAGPLASPAQLDALATALGRLSADQPETIALHRLAAAALADNPAAAARARLVDLLGAADPGVRRATAEALGRRRDADAGTDRALIARLRDDGWPGIRSLAAAALAARCGADTAPAQALIAAVTADAAGDVRRSALNALVTCRAPGVGALLLATASSREQPVPVRQRAIILVAVLGDRDLAPGLVALFATLRERAWSDARSLRLATAAAATLGRLGDPAAVPPLLAAARDPAFPELQAAAIIGLSELCPRQALPIFEQARASADRGVSMAARSAYQRCGRK